MQDLNGTLDETSEALDLAMQALFEDKLYFFNMRERWIDHFYVQRDQVLEDALWLLRWLVGNMIYRSHVKTLHGQGTGRFSGDEARWFREEIWVRLNGMLGESRRKGNGRGKECFGVWEVMGRQVVMRRFLGLFVRRSLLRGELELELELEVFVREC
jgi:hypothetical protein